MSILAQIYEKSKQNKELISIWEYGDESFWCGYILDYNDTLIQLKHYTKYGLDDGIAIIQAGNVQSVDMEDDYSRALQYMVDLKSPHAGGKGLRLPDDEDWQTGILKQIEGSGKIVSFEISGSDYFNGFVLHVGESEFVSKLVGRLGEEEGSVVYRNEDITAFRFEDLDLEKRESLYHWKKSKK